MAPGRQGAIPRTRSPVGDPAAPPKTQTSKPKARDGAIVSVRYNHPGLEPYPKTAPRGKRMLAARKFLLWLAPAAALSAAAQNAPVHPVHVTSPDGQIEFVLSGPEDVSAPAQPATLRYSVDYRGKPLIENSALGLDIDGQPPLGPSVHKVSAVYGQTDDTYAVIAGKSSSARNHCNWARVDLEESSGALRKMSVEVRVFNDGVAFRYLLPQQSLFTSFDIARERTEFHFAKDAVTYPLVLSGFQSSYEDEYQTRHISGLHPEWLVALPLLSHVPGVGWVAITEADIDNYAGMYLQRDPQQPMTLDATLSPRVDVPGVAVEAAAPMQSPWRVLMIAPEAGKLIESNLVINLNPPPSIADFSWVRPGKSAWDWWSGHMAKDVDFTPGMNTDTMKHYIEFASQSGFPYMLIDAGWAVPTHERNMDDITQVNPAIDMPELLRYAQQRNVRILLWAHWTSVNRYMDQAFPLFEKWGVAGVKIDFMNRDDQWMVDFYRRVVAAAAAHHLMIDFHGAYKPDGLRRTYPNLITRESVMGKEYSKWSARVTPVHDATLPYTRMLAGPMDYTPGAFTNVNQAQFIPQNVMPMSQGTRAHELALYVVFESPLEMVSDYPEQYKGQADFNFIKQVPATWDETRFLTGQPTENISLARRSGRDWYIGSITNWTARDVELPLSFLGPGRYLAEIYADAPDAADNPTHTTISKQEVVSGTTLTVHMVSGGGNAIWIHPVGGPTRRSQSR